MKPTRYIAFQLLLLIACSLPAAATVRPLTVILGLSRQLKQNPEGQERPTLQNPEGVIRSQAGVQPLQKGSANSSPEGATEQSTNPSGLEGQPTDSRGCTPAYALHAPSGLVESLSLIKHEGNRLLQLVNQLLDVARMKSGMADPQWQRGNISVESTLGKGTTFTITMPRKQKNSPTSLTPNPTSLTPDPSREGEGSIYNQRQETMEEVITPLSPWRGVGGEAESVRIWPAVPRH